MKDLFHRGEQQSYHPKHGDSQIDFNCIRLKAEEKFYFSHTLLNHFFFLQQGSIVVKCDDLPPRSFSAHQFFFFPEGAYIEGHGLSDCQALQLSFSLPTNTCYEWVLNFYDKQPADSRYEYPVLPIYHPLQLFVDQMCCYLDGRVNISYLYETKYNEFFLILKHFYTRQEVIAILLPLLCDSPDFKLAVLRNYDKVESVSELAGTLNMGKSKFYNLFKESFGVPAYQWMLKQKAIRIANFMMTPGVTISETIIRFGFNSFTHFNRFCRQQYGCSPREMMEQLRQKRRRK